MPIEDPLEGFRAPATDDLAPMERLLVRRMHESAGLIKLVRASEAMQQWMQTEAGQGLAAELESRLQAAMEVWLSATDPCSDKVRAAHSEARSCVLAFKMIDTIVERGPEAARSVRAADEVANSEGGEDD